MRPPSMPRSATVTPQKWNRKRRSLVDTQNRLDEVAGLDRGELTGYRRSRSCVLEARTKEASHGTSCDRSRWKANSNLRSQQRRANRGGAAVSDRGVTRVSVNP